MYIQGLSYSLFPAFYHKTTLSTNERDLVSSCLCLVLIYDEIYSSRTAFCDAPMNALVAVFWIWCRHKVSQNLRIGNKGRSSL